MILSGDKMHIRISEVNAFCRQKDLVFVEEGIKEDQLVLWFLDFQNNPIFYTETEICQAVENISPH